MEGARTYASSNQVDWAVHVNTRDFAGAPEEEWIDLVNYKVSSIFYNHALVNEYCAWDCN